MANDVDAKGIGLGAKDILMGIVTIAAGARQSKYAAARILLFHQWYTCELQLGFKVGN